MDVFLSEGMEFIFKMALAMLVLGKEQLLSMDMEAMLKVKLKRFVWLTFGWSSNFLFNFPQFFQKEIPQRIESDPDSLFNLAFAMKINTKKMKKMEKEYADLKKKEQEEMVELRVRFHWSIVN